MVPTLRRWLLAATGVLAGLLGACPDAVAGVDSPLPGALSAETLKVPDKPGSIRGLGDDPSVGVFSGQVTYGVPFDLPKGPRGYGPAAALTYSGELGNGPVGIGWSIKVPAIRRSLRQGVPTYTDADELELTGIGTPGRLIKIADGTYRVEGQGNAIKVEFESGRFKVHDADGVLYVLGATSGAREYKGTKVSAWFAEWVVDLVGQKITFEYEQQTGATYLKRIHWGPGDRFEALFTYAPRLDQTISYRTGFRVALGQRLAQVVVNVTAGGLTESLRTYVLTYDDTFTVSRLQSVQVLGRQGQGALPTLTFSYAKQGMPALLRPTGVSGWVLNERGVSLADVDGDGMSDLLRLEAGNHEYRKNLGTGFASARALTGASGLDLEGSRLMDLDGDARPELVSIVDDTWRSYSLLGETWEPLGEWMGTKGVALAAADTVIADVNGDGRMDVLTARTGGIGVRIAGATGLGRLSSLARIDSANVSVEPGARDVRFTDVNGDGLVDAVWLTDEWMKIYLGHGDGTFGAETRAFFPWHDGSNQAGTVGIVKPEDIQLADLDRDGLTDLIVFTAANVSYFQGRAELGKFGALRKLERPEGVAYDAVVAIADANGNGSQDIVWSSPRGMWVLDLAGPTSAGMIEEIDNGLGKSLRFAYQASAALSVESDAAGVPWSRKLPVSVPVPTKMISDPGDGPVRTVSYAVRDGFWDGIERRFGGFLVGREAIAGPSAARSYIEETQYHPGEGQARVLRGRPYRVVKSNAAKQTFEIAQNEWETQAVGGLGGDPLLRKAVLRRAHVFYEEDVDQPIETITSYEYDSEGRAIVERQFGRSDLAGDEKVIRRTYTDDDSTWVRDRVCEEQTLEGDEEVETAYTQTTYAGPYYLYGVCESPGFGWVREVTSKLTYAGEDRLVSQRTVYHDQFGNPNVVTEGGVTRRIDFDAVGLYPRTESVDDISATWSLDWDEILGQPTTLTDPNGDLSIVDYDSLGRPSALRVNSSPAHAHFAYDWTAPAPNTTTWVYDGRLADLPGSPWPSGAGWRRTVQVSNGAGDERYAAVFLAANRWIISGWRERDERGNVVLKAEPFEATNFLPVSRSLAARIETFEHDALGRETRAVLSNGSERGTDYSALQQIVSSTDLNPVTTFFDGLKRIARSERQVDGGIESVDATYDASDRITALTLQKGGEEVAHTFSYDTLGRLRQAWDPDAGPRVHRYFDTNLPKEMSNGNNDHLYFVYGLASRLEQRRQIPNIAVGDPSAHYFQYDVDSQSPSTSCRLVGRLAAAFDQYTESHYCYDAFGREIAVGRIIMPPDGTSTTATEEREYSTSGLLLGIKTDDGVSVRYAYDAAGRATSLKQINPSGGPDTVLWSVNQMDAAGRVTQETYGNGVTQAYAYDQLGLTKEVSVTSSGGGGTDLYHVLVNRNAYGAPVLVTDARHPGMAPGLDQNATFTYDGGGRLTGSTLGSNAARMTFTYAYDHLQNMISRQVSGTTLPGMLTGTYHYGERGYGPRQLTSVTQP